MKKPLIQFLIAMTIVSVLYTLYLKSRRERIARMSEIVFDSNQGSQKTDRIADTDPTLSTKGLVTTAKENVQALQTGMNDRFEHAKSALNLSKEPPPPTLLSEEMQRKKERAWKTRGGDGIVDQLLDDVRSTAFAYEQRSVKRCNKAYAVAKESKGSSDTDSP